MNRRHAPKHNRWQRTIDWVLVLDRLGGCCVHCGATEHLTIDHVVPRSRGGCDLPENWQPLCDNCNQRKGNRLEKELHDGPA